MASPTALSAGAAQHAARVARLYRHALKNIQSWAVDRELFWEEAEKLRGQFEANRNVDPATGSALVKRGEAELASKSHPDLYTVPYRPGGTLYARNPPVSPELHQQFDFGREGH